MQSPKKISMPLMVRDKIFRDILNGVWSGDNLLPGTGELARRYNCGFCSAAEAVRLLGEDGIIQRRSGRRARIVRGAHQRWQIGIVVDDALKDFPPFDYTNAATTFMKFNAVQLELINNGCAGLSMPPDLDLSAYLPQLDGVIVLRDTDGQWRYTESANSPQTVYCFNQQPETFPGCSSYIDYRSAFEKAATVLAARGVENVVLVSNSLRRNRFEVVRNVLVKYPQINCTMRICSRNLSDEEAESMAVELLDSVKPPCGFVVMGDVLGWCLCKEALRRKYVLKKDISIIGTAGLPESERMNPALSVIEVPVKAQAAAAVSQITAVLKGCTLPDDMQQIKVESRLILRDT